MPLHKRIVGSIKDGTATLFGRKVISKIPETEIAAPGGAAAALDPGRRGRAC